MESKDIMQALIDVHNGLAEISVRGDDVIRMANAIQRCRSIIFQMQNEDIGDSDTK